MVSARELRAFLSRVHGAISQCKYRILEYRQNYLDTVAQLGITEQDVIDDIEALTERENWIADRDDNPNFPGLVWICKKHLHGEVIYIKLKIPPRSDQLIIMSYHIDCPPE